MKSVRLAATGGSFEFFSKGRTRLSDALEPTKNVAVGIGNLFRGGLSHIIAMPLEALNQTVQKAAKMLGIKSDDISKMLGNNNDLTAGQDFLIKMQQAGKDKAKRRLP